jgi:hypothetical protein
MSKRGVVPPVVAHKMGVPVIVKVQRPLVGPKHMCLIYDERRSHTVEMRIGDAVLKTLERQQGMRSLKNFFWARWNGHTRQWEIDASKLAPWQDW